MRRRRTSVRSIRGACLPEPRQSWPPTLAAAGVRCARRRLVHAFQRQHSLGGVDEAGRGSGRVGPRECSALGLRKAARERRGGGYACEDEAQDSEEDTTGAEGHTDGEKEDDTVEGEEEWMRT